MTEPVANIERQRDPEQETLMADSIGAALLIVLDRLDPAERLAFVLHDMFAVSFDEIASILGRSSEASRQLASRARRRVQGSPAIPKASLAEQRQVVDAFLTALRTGDFEGLVAVLDPDVVVKLDEAAGRPGTPREIHGALNWAKGAVAFSRNLEGAVEPMLVNGEVGLVWAPQGRVFRVLRLSIHDGKIATVDIVADRSRLAEFEITVLDK